MRRGLTRGPDFTILMCSQFDLTLLGGCPPTSTYCDPDNRYTRGISTSRTTGRLGVLVGLC